MEKIPMENHLPCFIWPRDKHWIYWIYARYHCRATPIIYFSYQIAPPLDIITPAAHDCAPLFLPALLNTRIGETLTTNIRILSGCMYFSNSCARYCIIHTTYIYIVYIYMYIDMEWNGIMFRNCGTVIYPNSECIYGDVILHTSHLQCQNEIF